MRFNTNAYGYNTWLGGDPPSVDKTINLCEVGAGGGDIQVVGQYAYIGGEPVIRWTSVKYTDDGDVVQNLDVPFSAELDTDYRLKVHFVISSDHNTLTVTPSVDDVDSGSWTFDITGNTSYYDPEDPEINLGWFPSVNIGFVSADSGSTHNLTDVSYDQATLGITDGSTEYFGADFAAGTYVWNDEPDEVNTALTRLDVFLVDQEDDFLRVSSGGGPGDPHRGGTVPTGGQTKYAYW